MDIFEVIHDDHDAVRDAIEKLEKTSTKSSKSRDSGFGKLQQELLQHMEAEEKVFYPLLLEESEYREIGLRAMEEHSLGRHLMRELDDMAKDDERWMAKLQVFREVMEHHIEDEETEIFQNARELISEEQGQQLMEDFNDAKEEAGGVRSPSRKASKSKSRSKAGEEEEEDEFEDVEETQDEEVEDDE